MAFGFGPLPPASGGLISEDLAALFNPAAMARQGNAIPQAGQPTSFLERRRAMREAEDAAAQAGLLTGNAMGQSGAIMPPGQPQPEPLQMRGIQPGAPEAPVPVMAQMPPLSLGPLPGAPVAAPAPVLRRAPVPQQTAGLVGSPLPPPRPAEFGAPAEPVSPADMPASNAVPVQAQASAGGFDFGDAMGRFRDRGGFDMLGQIGMGLLSAPTWSGGLATGLQGYERSQVTKSANNLARAEYDLKRQKLAKEGRTQNATVQQIMRLNPGITQADAEARAANPTYVNELLKGTLPPTEGYRQEKDEDGNTFSVNTRTGQKTLLLKSESTKPALVDVPQPDGSTQKVWVKPGETAGVPVGAPERSGNSNVAVVTEERRKVADSLGWKPDSDQYKSFVATGKLPKEDQQTLTVTDKNAILEADEAISANRSTIGQLRNAIELSKKAYFGPTASYRGYATSLFGNKEGIATEELTNTVTGQALENLKATFGGAPTEGERKILLDIQGAASQAPEVREAIYARAIAAAERRMKFNEDRAAQLRGGTYYKAPQAGATAAPAATAPSPATPGATPARPQSKSDYDALSSGAQYIAPDGSLRTKP